MRETRDPEIREALHKKILSKAHTNPSSIVIDELGLLHGKSRVDIAVLNGCLHGYEIKSSCDTLSRTELQVDTYSKSLHKVTFVAAEKHAPSLLESLPNWYGLVQVTKGPRGAIHFSHLRPAMSNPNLDPFYLSHLLWKNEAIQILTKLDHEKKSHLTRYTKANLYKLLAETMNINDLFIEIQGMLSLRENWRDYQPLM